MFSSLTRCAGWLIACAIVSLCSSHRMAAAPSGADTIHRGMSILFIGTINSDCYPDTVWGARKGTIDHPFYLPEVIVWGRYDKAGLRGRKDTTEHCKGHIPKHRQLDYTLITYPAWSELRGSVTAFMLNPEDTLVDLMLAIRGSVGQGAERRDTMRLLALFGQSGLDTLASIDVGSIAISQIEPFAAMELRKGAEVNNEKQRDLSGRTSYELSRPSFREKKKEEKTKDTDTASPHASPAAGTTAGTLRVYPNPTGVAAQVEATSIPAGEYSVEIVAVNGEVSDRQEITVPESGTLLQRLDVEHLPTGYYMIRLRQRGTLLGTLLGTYPIVVTH